VREEDGSLRASSRPSSFMAGTNTGEVEVSDGYQKLTYERAKRSGTHRRERVSGRT
jgi:hypothetical protein